MNMVEYRRAEGRARRLYKSPGWRNTYLRGAMARLQGKPIDSCPYPRDTEKTWRLAYRNVWLSGWRSCP